MSDLPKSAEKLARSHARSMPAVSEQTWKQLRRAEAQSRRNRNWRVALVVVVVLAIVYAHYYLGLSR